MPHIKLGRDYYFLIAFTFIKNKLTLMKSKAQANDMKVFLQVKSTCLRILLKFTVFYTLNVFSFNNCNEAMTMKLVCHSLKPNI